MITQNRNRLTLGVKKALSFCVNFTEPKNVHVKDLI
jgi:hypothetical protein